MGLPVGRIRPAVFPLPSQRTRPAAPLRVAALGFLLAASGAHAGGFSIPDLGGQAIGEGCARVATPDDFSAIYYNPAGLAGQGGLRVQFDSRATLHHVGFQRLEADGSNPKQYEPIQNQGGVSLTSLAPMGGVSWRWEKGPVPLTFAIGGWPATGATGYQYPDPVELRAAGATEAEVAVAAPQRYASVYAGNKIYTAAAAVAARLTPWLDLGATFQLVNAQFRSRQAVASGIVAGENTSFDAILQLEGSDYLRPSGSVGVSVHLPYDLHVGGSLQLGARMDADGALQADLTPTLVAAGARLNGDQIGIAFSLPWIVRFGVRLLEPAWEVEVAGVVEGWHVLDEQTITPRGVSVTVAGTTVDLPVIHLRKDLRNSGSVRVGGLYRLGALAPSLSTLVVRLGGLLETSAVPEQRQTLDLMHWGRGAASAGLGIQLGALGVDLAYMHYFQADRQVRSSEVVQTVALPGKPASVVGNGDYTSNINLLSLALSYRFE